MHDVSVHFGNTLYLMLSRRKWYVMWTLFQAIYNVTEEIKLELMDKIKHYKTLYSDNIQ